MTRKLIVLVFVICNIVVHGYSQIVCADFVITGTAVTPAYVTSECKDCSIFPAPTGALMWTGADSSGFIKYTYAIPQNAVKIFYAVVNDNDIGTISVNGGGILSLSLVNDCANLSGNIVGPYTGLGRYGDLQVNITSTLPFTEVTLVNTGGNSGFVSGNCNSDTLNSTCFIDLGNDTTLCQKEILTLDAATLNATYLWQDSSMNSTFNVTQQGVYWVQITNSCGVLTDTISVVEEDCEIILTMPNVFTPNNDSSNDFFVPIQSKNITSMNTVIFNRWGNEIFYSDKLTIEWNGTLNNGTIASEGNYFWVINYTDIYGGEKNLKGFLVLTR